MNRIRLSKVLIRHEGLKTKPYYCVEENTKVLMADLSWKRIIDVEIGDEILTLEEYGKFDGYRKLQGRLIEQRKPRSWVVAKVTNKFVQKRKCYRVITDQGELLITGDHQVLVTKSGRSRSKKWRKIEDIYGAGARERRTSYLAFLFSPWDTPEDWERGYIAGAFDSDGFLTMRGNSNFIVGFAQKDNIVLKTVKNILKKYNFDFKEHVTPVQQVHRLTIRGGMLEGMRFLGMFRPQRLLEKFYNVMKTERFKHGAVKWKPACILTKIPPKYVGELTVVDITTTANTFIADGFFVHNCSSGKLTIGVGRNLEDVGISKDEALYMLQNDIDRAIERLDKKFPTWRNLDDIRQEVLINMSFNLGYKLFRFKKFLKAIEEKDYERASYEMLNSKWAEQVGRRAKELAYAMKYGKYPFEIKIEDDKLLDYLNNRVWREINEGW